MKQEARRRWEREVKSHWEGAQWIPMAEGARERGKAAFSNGEQLHKLVEFNSSSFFFTDFSTTGREKACGYSLDILDK